MTPNEFIAKWQNVDLTESAAAQSQFIDLCHLLEEPTPSEADPKGIWYAFEKGALKTGGGDGWADVWKRGCFAWEYKGKGKNLDAAFAQLQRYAIALENPPLLIVSDMERFRIHTNWTNTVQTVIDIPLEELADERRRRVLKWAFSETDVEQLKPNKTRQDLTEDVARGFAQLAQRLRERGHDPGEVAHFVNRLVFCMFAEDVELLPNHMFKRMLEASLRKPDEFEIHARQLFAAMRSGGPVGFERVDWFNGGLFDDDRTLPLTEDDIKQTLEVARLDWSNIDPSIMGTLFERGLDPDKRSQLGAHYTDRDKIMLIVNPVIVEPLSRKWEETRAEMASEIEKTHGLKKPSESKAFQKAQARYRTFIERLKGFRILDPACGSGNFLYLSLLALKDLEHRANLDAEALGLPREFPGVGPQCVKGIEINPFAAELARVSVWIGEIQWMKRNGFDAARNPILKPLETIECRDALLNPDGTEAEWPSADVIVGNPPFLGDKRMLSIFPETYVAQLRLVFKGRVSGGADLVMYWFARALEAIREGKSERAGLVATQSVRRGASSEVLKTIAASTPIFDAWSDEEWTVEGADVRVSLICFGKNNADRVKLDGTFVSSIYADLSAADDGADLTTAVALSTNKNAFIGDQKTGPFDIEGDLARAWLQLPMNPNGRPNSDVLKPWANGSDLTGRPTGKWIIDFGTNMPEYAAALYEIPFAHVARDVRSRRVGLREVRADQHWWLHQRPRPEMRQALSPLPRYIATPRVAKHRLFVWQDRSVLPDSRLVVIARGDDTSFGILHSRFHELWTLRLGGWHGVGNDPQYTPSLGYAAFPFPDGLTPNIPAEDYANDPRAIAIAEAAKKLRRAARGLAEPGGPSGARA